MLKKRWLMRISSTQEEYIASGLTYDATLRNLELNGEAVTHIPDEVRAAHPEIMWRMIVAMRNRFRIAKVLFKNRSRSITWWRFRRVTGYLMPELL